MPAEKHTVSTAVGEDYTEYSILGSVYSVYSVRFNTAMTIESQHLL